MSELEMTSEPETEEFTDELSDEALDREGAGGKYICFSLWSKASTAPVADR
jgi:hypothetical protein